MKQAKLVIGYGNPLRGDDGVGWRVAHLLAGALPSGAARILTVHQLTPELAEAVAGAKLLVLVDASALGKPGTWRCREITPHAARRIGPGHSFDARALLACARAIYHATPRTLLVSIAGESFTFQESLTPTVEMTLIDVVNRIRGELLAPETSCLAEATCG
ncbi:MAG TPA: hydrogenase maturation protease [Terrimicrobiaceae bacterium]|nr:hydrogenase maturation protease [Terrimicrobiaceae bacterium]